jgi:predicted ATPase
LPDEVVAHIVDRTDGVPLFVEELTKSVLESELLREEGDHYVLDGPLPPFAIPTSLHASLTARLDRLGSVRRSGAGSAMRCYARSLVFPRMSSKQRWRG